MHGGGLEAGVAQTNAELAARFPLPSNQQIGSVHADPLVICGVRV
jgi:hypothetical protein